MKIQYKLGELPDRPLLCVTHSDRVTVPEQCSLNYLERRYASPDRLAALPPFESLIDASHYSPYHGHVTLWDFVEGDWRRPMLFACLRPDFKPQHALWHAGRLWILGVERLEAYDASLRRIAEVSDPWLAGGHTVVPDGGGRLLLSCSGSDSVLVVDEKTYAVVAALRMPEAIYGSNYALARTDSVVEHFISNDMQLTHINCASPWRGGIVVSTLIQGAIGWFDPAGAYRELLRGYVGCHSVRTDVRTDQLFFCDSTTGTVVFLDDAMKIKARLASGSRWLQDACQTAPETLALAVTDRNQVEIIDLATREVMHAIPGTEFGEGPVFLDFSPNIS
jgi:hypothetical protein